MVPVTVDPFFIASGISNSNALRNIFVRKCGCYIPRLGVLQPEAASIMSGLLNSMSCSAQRETSTETAEPLAGLPKAKERGEHHDSGPRRRAGQGRPSKLTR